MLLIVITIAFLKAVTTFEVVKKTVVVGDNILPRVPKPTTAPEFAPNLILRDFTSVCGYVNGNACKELFCPRRSDANRAC